MNFNQMPGNEILYNLTNYEYFRKTELIAGLHELSKRVQLSANQEYHSFDWSTHPLVAPPIEKVIGMLKSLNVYPFNSG